MKKKLLFISLLLFFYWLLLIENLTLYKIKYNLKGKFDNTLIEFLKNEERTNKIFKLDGSGHNFSLPFNNCINNFNFYDKLNKSRERLSSTFYVLSYKNDTLQLMEFIVSREFDSPVKYNLDKHLNGYNYIMKFISLYNEKYNANITYKILPEFTKEETWRINMDFLSLLKLICIPLILWFVLAKVIYSRLDFCK